MHTFSHFWWKSLDGKFENITQSTHYEGGLEHRLLRVLMGSEKEKAVPVVSVLEAARDDLKG